MHSIRLKIMVTTVIAVLISFLALGTICVFSIGAQSDRNSVEKMGLLSENTQLGLDHYLDSIEQSVSMAIRMAHDSLNSADIEYLGNSGTPLQVGELDEAMSAHCDAVEYAFTSIANSTSGVVTFYYCINSDYGSNEHGFFWSKVGEADFVKQPDLISSDLDRNDTEHNTWYYTPLKASAPVWVGPYSSHYLDDRQVVSYVAPIFHHGFVVGVLGMDILFDTIIEQIQDVRVYDTGFAFLMDRDGNILYHPDGASAELDPNLGRELMRRRSTGSMLVRYDRNQSSWQLAFSTLNNDFKVGVTAPVSEITAYRRRLVFALLATTILLLAVLSVIVLLMMNALTKPLIRLTSASQRLMAGDYDAELDYNGKDELGILTQAFVQMRDHMKLTIKDLNSRVYTDSMTGVKNKAAFELRSANLNRSIRVGGECAPEFAIVMLDCNKLKKINDTYGHERGDIYLLTACTAICKVFAHSPVFRLGGDEFAVVLQKSDYENRTALLAEFDDRTRANNETAENPWERIDISKGMAVYRAEADADVDSVLRRADEMMYMDKQKKDGAA